MHCIALTEEDRDKIVSNRSWWCSCNPTGTKIEKVKKEKNRIIKIVSLINTSHYEGE